MEGKPQPPYYSGVSSKPSALRHSARKFFFCFFVFLGDICILQQREWQPCFALLRVGVMSSEAASGPLPTRLCVNHYSPFFPPLLTFTFTYLHPLCVSSFISFPALISDFFPFPLAPPPPVHPPLSCHKFCFNYRQSSSPQIDVYFSPALRSLSLLEASYPPPFPPPPTHPPPPPERD